MVSRATRFLINAAAFLGLCWIALVIYESFTYTGLWRVVDRALSTEASHPNAAGTFAICTLAGSIPIGALAWLVWRVALRGRLRGDFPIARLRK